MNTNALPQTGGIPLRAQPLEPPYQPPTPSMQPARQYLGEQAVQHAPVQASAPSAPAASADRAVRQPGVGPNGARLLARHALTLDV